jgi:predicted amidohydrolase YtcJ
MEKHHAHHHGCTQCACNNPVLEILKEELFSPENLAKINPGPGKAQKQPQTIMIIGGTIRPMIGGSTDTVEDNGIAEGKVVVTGTQTSVTAFMEQNFPAYTTKTLAGTQTLLPGLIEPHVHMVPTAMMSKWVDVSPFKGQDLLAKYDLDTVKDKINKHLPDNFQYVILGKGLDPSLMPFLNIGGEKELLTIDNTVLDEINIEVPMMLLSASMHTLYLNTAGYSYVYQNSTEISSQYASVADYITATKGQLQESAQMSPALATVKTQVTDMANDINTYLTDLFKLANKRGVTFMYDAGLNSNFSKLLTNYASTHPERVRTGGALLCSTQPEVTSLGTYQQPSAYSPVYYGHVKVVSDGSNQGLTGYQSSPYNCDPANNTGIFNFPLASPPSTMPPVYQSLISTVISQQWPLMIHANGDQAVTFAIEAYQSALEGYSGPELRNRIEHCSLLTTAQISTMHQMAVSPSFLIGHVGYWGHAFSKVIFGQQKSQMLDLCASSLAAGMRITLHSDNEVSPLGPLRMMEQSITRIMEEETLTKEVLNSAECLSPEQALIAVTYDAAWQCYADQWVGSLDAGYFADFVILAQDPLSMTTQDSQYMKMRNIPVLETWLGGVAVHVAVDHESLVATVQN